MDAVLLAGGVPQEEDLLYSITLGRPKALIDVAGKAMAQWVLDALTAAPSVTGITVMGIGAGEGLSSSKITSHLSDQGSMLGNSLAGIEAVVSANPEVRQVLMVGCDIPLLTSEMVESLVALTADATVEIYHSLR